VTTVELLRAMFRNAHDTLERTMADVTPEQAHWLPPGAAIPIGAEYAHIVGGEDAVLNMFVRKAPPLLATTWAGRTGMSELMPQTAPWDIWARSVKIDLAQMRQYAQAVYAQTDEYLASLEPNDLDAELDFAGRRSVADALGCVLLSHVNNHCGEISLCKGLQGAKGYPF
jgi:hypothetical protein